MLFLRAEIPTRIPEDNPPAQRTSVACMGAGNGGNFQTQTPHTMKTYLLFAGSYQYPRGGWGDYIGSADSLDEALALLPKGMEWHHVVHNEGIVEAGGIE